MLESLAALDCSKSRAAKALGEPGGFSRCPPVAGRSCPPSSVTTTALSQEMAAIFRGASKHPCVTCWAVISRSRSRSRPGRTLAAWKHWQARLGKNSWDEREKPFPFRVNPGLHHKEEGQEHIRHRTELRGRLHTRALLRKVRQGAAMSFNTTTLPKLPGMTIEAPIMVRPRGAGMSRPDAWGAELGAAPAAVHAHSAPDAGLQERLLLPAGGHHGQIRG